MKSSSSEDLRIVMAPGKSLQARRGEERVPLVGAVSSWDRGDGEWSDALKLPLAGLGARESAGATLMVTARRSVADDPSPPRCAETSAKLRLAAEGAGGP
ncbi:hypothetical protein ACN28E_38835 [Archangium lansingense]|uniref:hypothetical protein n=1 Tax=Archangium lansingense TaxID=2995310 RepID=UPI003B8244D5